MDIEVEPVVGRVPFVNVVDCVLFGITSVVPDNVVPKVDNVVLGAKTSVVDDRVLLNIGTVVVEGIVVFE